MHKQVFYLTVSLFFLLYSTCVLAEDITITTYYPSPNGSYSSLQAERLGVGDNNADGSFTSADVPTNSGDVWIKGSVGIGTTSPESLLHIGSNNGAKDNVPRKRLALEPPSHTGGAYDFQTRDDATYAYLDIGYAGAQSFTMRNDGYVGIGITSPISKLHVSGGYVVGDKSYGFCNANYQSGRNLVWSVSPTTTNWGISYFQGGADYFAFHPNGDPNNPLMVVRSPGVGIGTTSPTYQLQLSTDSAAKPGTNTWTIVSDARIKKDIRPYTNGLSIIKRINPVWFKYNGKAGFPNDNQEHIGVIAQEIVKVAPYTVNTFRGKLNPEDKKETDLLNFNSHALTFDLINAVKELDSNIIKLSQENQELRSEMENLKTRLSSLETRTK